MTPKAWCDFSAKWDSGYYAFSTLKQLELRYLVKPYQISFRSTKCPAENKTRLLFLLLDVEYFEVTKHLGLKSTTNFDKANTKLKDYFTITETSDKLQKWLDLQSLEASETIESFARDVKFIGHCALLKAADSLMLENIRIKQFTNSLNNELSREYCVQTWL